MLLNPTPDKMQNPYPCTEWNFQVVRKLSLPHTETDMIAKSLNVDSVMS